MGDDAPEVFVGTPGADIFCGFEEADSSDGKGTDRLVGGTAIDRFRADPGDILESVEQAHPCSTS